MLLQAATGDVIYQIDYDTLKKYGLLSDAEIYMINIPGTDRSLDHALGLKVLAPDDFLGAEEKFLVYGDIRNKTAAAIAKKYQEQMRVLIFVKRIAHGNLLKSMIPGSTFIHGGCKTKERLSVIDEEKGVLISTSIFEEGIDTPNFDVIINCAGGKSPISTAQKIGRGLRNEKNKILRVFDFIDHVHPVLLKHSKARMKVYKQFGYKMQEITL